MSVAANQVARVVAREITGYAGFLAECCQSDFWRGGFTGVDLEKAIRCSVIFREKQRRSVL